MNCYFHGKYLSRPASMIKLQGLIHHYILSTSTIRNVWRIICEQVLVVGVTSKAVGERSGSLLRIRFLGCHATLPPKKRERCVTSQKTAAEERNGAGVCFARWLISQDFAHRLCFYRNAWEPARRLYEEQYRKIHYLTREFRVKLHAKTDIARIAKRWVRYRFSSAI